MKRNFKVMALAVALVLCLVVTSFAAITISITRNFGTADSLERIRDFTVTFDSSYPTGGEQILASDVALGSLYNVACQPTSGYTISYNYVSALIIYDISGGATGATAHQLANGTDISNLVVRCRATGK